MNVFELTSALELVGASVLGLQLIRARQALNEAGRAPVVNLCECDHASAFHGDKGCRSDAGKKTVDVWGQVTWTGCGCQRFTRRGSFFDPNTENDLQRLDRLAHLDEVTRVKKIIPFIRKTGPIDSEGK